MRESRFLKSASHILLMHRNCICTLLQRQQAAAIIDARQKIVEGAVGMVEMALDKLNENDIVELDEERKERQR